MLLTGTYSRSLDDKNRLAIPKKVRDTLGSDTAMLYLAPGTDRSLTLYTEEAFSRLGEQLSQGSPTGQEIRAFSRLFYTQAEAIELDRQGRIRVPPELARLAGLGRDVVLLGVRDHLEIWDKQRWDQYLAEKQTRYDEIAESAFQPLTPVAGQQPRTPQQRPATEDSQHQKPVEETLTEPPRTQPSIAQPSDTRENNQAVSIGSSDRPNQPR
jgi:MraZ protein